MSNQCETHNMVYHALIKTDLDFQSALICCSGQKLTKISYILYPLCILCVIEFKYSVNRKWMRNQSENA